MRRQIVATKYVTIWRIQSDRKLFPSSRCCFVSDPKITASLLSPAAAAAAAAAAAPMISSFGTRISSAKLVKWSQWHKVEYVSLSTTSQPLSDQALWSVSQKTQMEVEPRRSSRWCRRITTGSVGSRLERRSVAERLAEITRELSM